jgi:hypothetical protein
MAQLGRFVYVAPGPAASGTSNYPLRIDTKIPTAVLTSVTVNTNFFTKVGHGLSVGDVVVITAGTAPGALSLNTPYFVSHVTGNDLYISSSLPTSVTGSTVINHLTFASGTAVTINTTFKGETIPTATGLITTAPVAELSPFVVRDIQGTAHQTVTTTFSLSNSASLFSNSGFTAGSNASTTISGWTQITGSSLITQYNTANYPTPAEGFVLQFDEDAVSGTFPGIYQSVSVPTETYTIYGGTTIVEPACLYAAQVRIINYVATLGNLSQYVNLGIVVRIKGFNSLGNAIDGCVASTLMRPQPTASKSGWTTATLIADFRAFKDQLSGGSIQVEMSNATNNGTTTASNTSTVYVDSCNVYAIPNVPKTSTTDTTVDTQTKLVKVYGTKINSTATSPAYGGYLKNRHFYYDVSATTNNWQNQQYVSIQFKLAAEFEGIPQSFTMGLQNGSATAISWGADGVYDPENGWLTFSLNAWAKASRNNVKAVYIRCNNDYITTGLAGTSVTGGTSSTSIAANVVIFYIGKLVYNGELQSGGKYEYAFTRWKAAPSYTTTTSNNTFTQIPPYAISGITETFFGGVESALSKISTPVNTSNAESRLRLNLAGDFRDASGDGYTHLLVYRRNTSTFTDGRFRLIAQIDVMPTTPVLVSSSSNVSLEAGATQSQIYLLDNVGDIELLFDNPQGKTGNIYKGNKDFFPRGTETIAIHQSRIWMSINNTLQASWLLDNDNEYALHTSEINVPTDPYSAIKGVTFDVSGQFDNEPITALLPFSGEGLSKNNSSSNALLVLRNNSILPITGSDASSFTVLGFTQEAGSGCIAAGCAQTVMGKAWWLSNSGIMQYAGGVPLPVSVQLDRLINARSHNPLIANGVALTVDQSLQRTSSSVAFDNKFIFSSSQPGGTKVDTLFIFDFKTNGWYEWQMPQFGGTINIRHLYVLNTAIDAPELYVTASNGHIYKYTGTQDKQTAGAGLTAFRWAVLSRQYGQTYAQGLAYYAQNLIHQLDVHVHSDASNAIDWRIYNNNQPDLVSRVFNADPVTPPSAYCSSGTYTFGTGEKLLAIRNIGKQIRGASYSVELSGQSLTSPASSRIYAFMMHVAESGIRRNN